MSNVAKAERLLDCILKVTGSNFLKIRVY
jgi:hypothetical protein